FDLNKGIRGSRQDNLSPDFFGTQGILLVNNNASACLLVLSALAKGKEVIVSRSELVEIGGSFRIPEVMELSGCTMREVGTTNKTKLSDYERAINDNTGLILKVHRSNFRIDGFVEEVSVEELSGLARKFNIPFYYDIGSGALSIIKSIEKDEPTISETLKNGADIVSFSSDKLLGGCQGGLILGQPLFIEKMKRHPLYRAIRPDKITIYYLERLLYYLSIEDYSKSPVLDMIFTDIKLIKKRALRVFKEIKGFKDLKAELIQDMATFGGGSLPLKTLPTYVIRFKSRKGEERTRNFFLNNDPPILIRQKDGYVIIDFRTIFNEEVPLIINAIKDYLSAY
ncbi:MAG: L-seryl-tRNA(Sec) selenium transferase, partial [Proteobacteria bacterium]|nr:L-seryl-tRNA(Sec) selenium transferase [Pseudomonadota bacterium]